ncbi:nitrate reductase associated protein [Caulobacter sp. KR2-114]|uniref:nitrate reductase associated protein n=1 Tax=Caulobacter sp. KR2-114 TaxID=3400912 RepID=UPI003C108E11
MNHAQLFAFEDDFVASLRCIPMAVRFKLDRCGVKLSLRQWSRFTRDDRQWLLEAPCATDREAQAYRLALVGLVARRAGEAAKPLAELPSALWAPADATPAVIAEHARDKGLRPPSDREWASLSTLQRFVLIKLTRDNHDNVNFVPALREFGLAA